MHAQNQGIYFIDSDDDGDDGAYAGLDRTISD